MDLEKLTKKELQEKCTELKINFKEIDNKTTLKEKINSIGGLLEETADIKKQPKRVEEIKEKSHKVESEFIKGVFKNVFYKAKKRWIYLGKFDNKNDVKRKLIVKGSKEYKIE